jgi:hypothetical protein
MKKPAFSNTLFCPRVGGLFAFCAKPYVTYVYREHLLSVESLP